MYCNVPVHIQFVLRCCTDILGHYFMVRMICLSSNALISAVLILFTSPNFSLSPLKHLAATKLAMSSAQRQSTHRHDSSSSDPVKNISVNIERSTETPEPEEQDYYTRYPNNWAKIRSATRCRSQTSVAYGPHRELIREPAAEMLGTMILTLFGTAGNCQVVLSANTGVASSPKGDYLSLAIGWACG